MLLLHSPSKERGRVVKLSSRFPWPFSVIEELRESEELPIEAFKVVGDYHYGKCGRNAHPEQGQTDDLLDVLVEAA